MLYTGLRLDYRLRLRASTSASCAHSAVAELCVVVVITDYVVRTALRVLDDSSEIGPKLSEASKAAAAPEPLIRDESLRKTESIREWDKGKKPVYGRVALCCYSQYFSSLNSLNLRCSDTVGKNFQ